VFEFFEQLRICIDIYLDWLKALLHERFFCHLAKMTSRASIEEHLMLGGLYLCFLAKKSHGGIPQETIYESTGKYRPQ
jgi:hypothetical protein